jgi:hypothetical protein
MGDGPPSRERGPACTFYQRIAALRLRAAMSEGREVWSDEYRFRTTSGWEALVSDRGFIERDPAGNRCA